MKLFFWFLLFLLFNYSMPGKSEDNHETQTKKEHPTAEAFSIEKIVKDFDDDDFNTRDTAQNNLNKQLASIEKLSEKERRSILEALASAYFLSDLTLEQERRVEGALDRFLNEEKNGKLWLEALLLVHTNRSLKEKDIHSEKMKSLRRTIESYHVQKEDLFQKVIRDFTSEKSELNQEKKEALAQFQTRDFKKAEEFIDYFERYLHTHLDNLGQKNKENQEKLATQINASLTKNDEIKDLLLKVNVKEQEWLEEANKAKNKLSEEEAKKNEERSKELFQEYIKLTETCKSKILDNLKQSLQPDFEIREKLYSPAPVVAIAKGSYLDFTITPVKKTTPMISYDLSVYSHRWEYDAQKKEHIKKTGPYVLLEPLLELNSVADLFLERSPKLTKIQGKEVTPQGTKLKEDKDEANNIVLPFTIELPHLSQWKLDKAGIKSEPITENRMFRGIEQTEEQKKAWNAYRSLSQIDAMIRKLEPSPSLPQEFINELKTKTPQRMQEIGNILGIQAVQMQWNNREENLAVFDTVPTLFQNTQEMLYPLRATHRMISYNLRGRSLYSSTLRQIPFPTCARA